jgi:methyltransferase (TIGR00027 family)
VHLGVTGSKMEPGQASQTAIFAARMRAAHLHLYPGPKIHEDTFALALSGVGGVDALRAFAEQVEQLIPVRRAAAYFASRHRFSEERLQAAVDRGVEQVIILGAGLDSFALRHPPVPKDVLFLEIDHPDSQRWKRGRLSSLGLQTPGVHYLPIDFASQDLQTELAGAGVDLARPSFVAWLCVTQYVAESVAYETLSLVARQASGSQIVFDVILPIDAQPPGDRDMSRVSAAVSADQGEPWVSYFAPEPLSRRLASIGFARVEWLTPETLRAYYEGQPAQVQPLVGWQVVAATVAPPNHALERPRA